MNATMGLFDALLVLYPTTKSLSHILLLSKAMQKLEKRNDSLNYIRSSHGSSRLSSIYHKSRFYLDMN
jgi:hypothetical protein